MNLLTCWKIKSVSILLLYNISCYNTEFNNPNDPKSRYFLPTGIEITAGIENVQYEDFFGEKSMSDTSDFTIKTCKKMKILRQQYE